MNMTSNSDPKKRSLKNAYSENVTPDKHDAWVLRAGAELWKSVVIEGEHPAEDTRLALQSVRAALNAARSLRYANDISEAERRSLVRLAIQAEAEQAQALRRWGLGRGLAWEEDWGERWGEMLAQETVADSSESSPDEALNFAS